MPISLTGIPSSSRDRQRDAALGGAVELGQHDAGHRRPPRRTACAWRRPFCPVVASTVSSVSCGAPGQLLGDHAAHLGQLGHQVVLGVQAAGGVDDDHVGALAHAGGDGVVGDRAGVGVLRRPCTKSTPARSRPHLELLDGGGAEGVGRAEHDLVPELLAQVPGELADRRRLAGAVDADHQQHRRPRRAGRCGRRPATGRSSASSSVSRAVSASPPITLAALGLLLELLDDLGGRPRADVGVDQRLLEALPRLLVELAANSVAWISAVSASRVLRMFSRRRRKNPRRRSGSGSSGRPRPPAPSCRRA